MQQFDDVVRVVDHAEGGADHLGDSLAGPDVGGEAECLCSQLQQRKEQLELVALELGRRAQVWLGGQPGLAFGAEGVVPLPHRLAAHAEVSRDVRFGPTFLDDQRDRLAPALLSGCQPFHRSLGCMV